MADTYYVEGVKYENTTARDAVLDYIEQRDAEGNMYIRYPIDIRVAHPVATEFTRPVKWGETGLLPINDRYQVYGDYIISFEVIRRILPSNDVRRIRMEKRWLGTSIEALPVTLKFQTT